MALSLYNVRTRQKEIFQPIVEGKAGLYLCGLTVYDHVHLGHGRTAVSFEVIRRWLERSYELRFIQNVTDVDDNIINRAAELGVSPREHSNTWDKRAVEVLGRLGVRKPDEAPHVTDSIDDIIAFIEDIIARGYAYATAAGNVYFDVPAYDAYAKEAFPECAYGHLSNRDYKQMAAGTRKQVENDKKHPADFALWKAAGPDDHPDSSWESTWGPGRPGWHIECSLMSTRALGNTIDIHGGGQDLIFPHHENEIAQSQAKTGEAPFVNTWIHTGFLNVEGTKMSKSLGNFIVLEEFLDEIEDKGLSAEVLRFYFAQTHYRTKIDFSRNGLREAGKAVERLHRTRRLLQDALDADGDEKADGMIRQAAMDLAAGFDAAMDDDIHTPGAIASLFTFLKTANPYLEAGRVGKDAARRALDVFEDRGHVLTLFDAPAPVTDRRIPNELHELADALAIPIDGLETEKQAMEQVLLARQTARKEKDWGRADALRDKLAAAGYTIEDTPNGPRWHRA